MGPFYVRRKVRFPPHVLGSRGAHIGQARENFLFSFKPHPAPKPHRWKASSSAKHGRGLCFPVRQMPLGQKGERSAKRYQKTCRTAGFLICSIFRFFALARDALCLRAYICFAAFPRLGGSLSTRLPPPGFQLAEDVRKIRRERCGKGHPFAGHRVR